MVTIAMGTITGPLMIGHSGADVRELQKALNATPGGARLAADGVFGVRTDGALKVFQMKRGLRVDGVVGPKTAAALGLKYRALRWRPAAVQPGVAPRHHPATALETVAEALTADLKTFMDLVKAEFQKTGAPDDKIANAIKGMDEVIIPDLLKAIKDWSQGDISQFKSIGLQTTLVNTCIEIKAQFLTYLKNHGGEVGGAVDRLDSLDTDAICRIVEFMFKGKENATAAAFDIGQVMRKALA